MHIINVVFLLGSESYNRCHHHSAVTCPTLVWATGLQNLVYSYNVTLSLSVTELSGMLKVNSQDRLSQPALMLSYCWQHSFAAISRWSVGRFHIRSSLCKEGWASSRILEEKPQTKWLQQQQEILGATDDTGSGYGVGGPSAFSTWMTIHQHFKRSTRHTEIL